MLTCPYCQHRVQEDSPHCPSCSLSVKNAASILGPIPLLNPGLTDIVEILSKKQTKQIRSSISTFQSAFPYSQLSIVLHTFDPKFNLSTQLFWLFNSAGLSTEENQLEKNQDVLIGLDPASNRLGLIIGYGLEPYISQNSLSALLELARPDLEEGSPTKALQLVIKKLAALLNNSSQAAKEALGI